MPSTDSKELPPEAVKDIKQAESIPQNGPAGVTTAEKKHQKKQSICKPANPPNGSAPATEGDGGKKLSNAELKKQKQAEKAAKRAQAKQDQGTPADLIAAQTSNATAKPGKRSDGAGPPGTPGGKQHKRGGSVQKALPLRPVQTSNKAAPVVTVKEMKDSSDGKSITKVALFGHLYEIPRRTTIAGANKNVHPAVLALGLQMSNYVICGSSARCVAMLLAFKRVIESYITPPGNSIPRHLNTHLSHQIEYLISCRPLSTSMGNAIRWLKLEISSVDPATAESEAKDDLCDSIDNFIRERITVADQVIATTAVEKIRDGDVILTYAKSNIVQQTLIQAFRQGRKFSVIVVDARPMFEGKNLLRTLVDLGIDTQYCLTNALSKAIESATKVFLGAHSMMSNGRLYSRIGSASVAMLAKEADVPVIVCCESIKFTDKIALDSIVTNEVAPADELVMQKPTTTALNSAKEVHNLQLLNLMYDATPAEYITMVITEFGSLPPSSVPSVFSLSTDT